jgi:hypothetical protein
VEPLRCCAFVCAARNGSGRSAGKKTKRRASTTRCTVHASAREGSTQRRSVGRSEAHTFISGEGGTVCPASLIASARSGVVCTSDSTTLVRFPSGPRCSARAAAAASAAAAGPDPSDSLVEKELCLKRRSPDVSS